MRLVSLARVTRRFGLSPHKVRQQILAGDLAVLRLGGRPMVLVGDEGSPPDALNLSDSPIRKQGKARRVATAEPPLNIGRMEPRRWNRPDPWPNPLCEGQAHGL